jgi:dimethylglycine dehydrogenase
MDRFVKWEKPDFRGKAALAGEKQQGVKKRFVTLVVENPGDCDAPYMATLWHGGKIVGETLSGGFGHRVDKSIALGMLRADLSEAGTEIEVEIFGDRFKAVVQKDEPLWDPKNERLRA